MIDILAIARETLETEAQSILDQVPLLNGHFEKAVLLIAASKGKLVLTGMGKSGIIGKKIAATLASTGTPSFFMHPGEAYHGDLGMLMPNDIVLALSNSGETDEVLKIIPFFRDNGNKIIAISGNAASTLAKNADVHIAMSIVKEACPLKLAPTSSTTVTLALGDALAVALMKVKDFREDNFARFHPGGSLGRRLLVKVEDVMIKKHLPIVKKDSNLSDTIHVMGKGRLGLTLVNEAGKTIGIITDGDVRRLMETKGKNCFDMKATEMMTVHPKSISSLASLSEAEEMFGLYKINSLLVVNEKDDLEGIVQIYDI
jgi:arabinose-5-phosphate isomerase